MAVGKVIRLMLLLVISLHMIQQISALGLIGNILGNMKPKECEPHFPNIGFKPMLHLPEIIAELKHIRNMLEGRCACNSPAASLGLNTGSNGQLNDNNNLSSLFQTLATRNAAPAAPL
ncbi:uncharacterized protein LOC116431316 [Nomia melanderi]|uniref:uncharacterized protein LOC116431316 n=1 Tax=Nomia melanderi TaxID=2448451 RepID=UPI001304538C|nr:uncharacterized protein LOC116431316 [Nomia melanderi]